MLQVMRAVRNTYIPINRLPPEILSRVLEHRDSEQDLIDATHVCQHWRSTLTSSPSLWTNLQFRSAADVDQTRTYLERSKSVIIDIMISVYSSQDPEVLEYFAPHISRTRSFVVHGTNDIFSFLLRNPAPSLERLDMCASGRPVRGVQNFLGQQAPSLRSIIFDAVFPVLGSPFPLPNLTYFYLNLPSDAGLLRSSSLLRFLSCCPRLQEIIVNTWNEILQDATSDQVILLESLVKCDYSCRNSAGKVLPYLKLPRLDRLKTFTFLGEGQDHIMADILPRGGQGLLARVTDMSYTFNGFSQGIFLSGKGTSVSITAQCDETNHVRVDWFSNETRIPFGRIEELDVEGNYPAAGFSLEPFKGLTMLRATFRNVGFIDEILQLLLPDGSARVPCPSLRGIQCTSWGNPGPLTRSLINAVKERGRAGQRLELVHILATDNLSQDLEQEMREHVGELRFQLFTDARV